MRILTEHPEDGEVGLLAWLKGPEVTFDSQRLRPADGHDRDDLLGG